MIKKLITNLKKILASIERDRITIYAAQASYYVIVSAIPFICLLISTFSFFVPTDIYSVFEVYEFPREIENFLFALIDQLFATQKVSLLSISAIVALWTASRGADAIRVGLERVYHERPSKKFVRHQLKSLASTLILIVILISNVVFSVFGAVIAERLHLTMLFEIIMYFSIPILFVVMCLAFTLLYAFVGKFGEIRWRERFLQHLPGGVFTATGWMLFSYIFALYLYFFPYGSAIYGSLTAVCLTLLWIYIYIVIILLGAEVNKILLRNKGIIVQYKEIKENHNI